MPARNGEALHVLGMHHALHCRTEFTAPQALALPVMTNRLPSHVVT